jgi:hypothetical protein
MPAANCKSKAKRKIIFFLLLPFILAACNFPYATPGIGVPAATTAPADQPCAFMWATQPLPDLSTQIQAAVDSAGLRQVQARAEAFGENCIDSQSNKPVSFGAMETDFHITAIVSNLTNKDNLGNLLEKILVILDGFPAGKIPGPNPGIINVSFQSGSDELNLSLTVTEGKSARALGYHGAMLFEELQNK